MRQRMAAAANPRRLQVHSENPRWFQQGGRALALFGSGLWTIIPDATVDIAEHNAWYARCGANANRATLFAFCTSVPEGRGLAPWPRTGPGSANDGLPRFDLTRWDERFWERLHAYLSDGGHRGIVVLLQIWDEPFLEHGAERWRLHPFNPANHVHPIAGLPATRDHRENFAVGVEDQFYDPDNAELMRFQDALVKRLLDETALRYGHIIYEVGNEICLDSRHPHERRWQQHWIDVFREYERAHGVKLLLSTNTREELFAAGAAGLDVVNHHGFSGLNLPPRPGAGLSAQVQAAVARHFSQYARPVINSRPCSDPDRSRYGDVVTEDVGRKLFWSYFCSGGHVVGFRTTVESWKGGLAAERIIQGVQTLAASVRLDRFGPHPRLVDRGLCLADPGRRYIIYLPEGGGVTVSLPSESVAYRAFWYNPRTCRVERTQSLTADTQGFFTAPDGGDWVLDLMTFEDAGRSGELRAAPDPGASTRKET